MMIRIETIRMEKFRGVRVLTLTLKGENFGICGPNGTGKSGVVDAIEFALTGNVSRLSGVGAGDLSVKAHAPHVKERDAPKEAKVTLGVYIPSLKKSATVTRTVASPTKYSLHPDEPAIRAVIDETEIHPEFALSRREIIRFILAQPNKRASDVQELLRLAEIEQTRKAFSSLNTQIRRERDNADQALAKARRELQDALGLKELKAFSILAAINERRATLGLAAVEKLSADTSLKEGAGAAPKDENAPIKKAEATADLETLTTCATEGEPENIALHRKSAIAGLQALIDDEPALLAIRQSRLVALAIDLVDGDACPLCDKEWVRDELLAYLNAKQANAQDANAKLLVLGADLNAIIGEIDAQADLLKRVLGVAGKLKPAPDVEPLKLRKIALEEAVKTLRDFVSEGGELTSVKHAAELDWRSIVEDVEPCLEAVAAAIKALPEISEADKARDFLTVAEDRYRRSIDARTEFDEAERRAKIAAKALEHYQSRSDGVLEALYDEVAQDFTSYYRSLNSDDEGDFVGKLIPSAAKLGFNVDFYGYGEFPPGAYHSEGHQDGMGLCLYLALMKRTLGDKFTFSVLDDVLMSVDADHRREVCKLLKREFPDTQFILTTHDRVWLKFMQTEGLIKQSQTFSGWSVETGPRVWSDNDVWAEIDEALSQSDVVSAASALRRYLEFIAAALADSFRAEVRFKGDGQYDLGDLMPPVINRWRKKIAEAEKAAKSWGKEKDAAKIAQLITAIDDARARISAEQWAINPNIHYNAWANFQAKEFKSVVDAFSDLLATMRCKSCNAFVDFQPRHGSAETIRCNCGDTFFNLKLKA